MIESCKCFHADANNICLEFESCSWRGVLNTPLCLSVPCDMSVVFSVYSGFLHYNWPPRYNWNIVESGVQHHKPHPFDNICTKYYNDFVLEICLNNVYCEKFNLRPTPFKKQVWVEDWIFRSMNCARWKIKEKTLQHIYLNITISYFIIHNIQECFDMLL